MDISNYLHESFKKYYDALTVLGYKPESDVYSLVIISFIEDIINGPMSEYITDEDYKTICLALNCFYGNCLFPYPIKEGSNMFGEFKAKHPRISEDGLLRHSENSILRYSS